MPIEGIEQRVIFERTNLGGQTNPVKVIDATTPPNEREVPKGHIDSIVAKIATEEGVVLRSIPLDVSKRF